MLIRYKWASGDRLRTALQIVKSGKAMNWAERQKERGVRLELTPHDDRCWKKFRGGKTHYLMHPLTKGGYEAAVLEWSKLVAKLDSERPNAKQFHHHQEIFGLVQNWYDHFGVPDNESKVPKQVAQFLEWLDEQLEEPELPEAIPFMAFLPSRPEFRQEFVAKAYTLFGREGYTLGTKWRERIRQLDESPSNAKQPQTIEHWVGKYIQRLKSRGRSAIKIGTAKDQIQKLGKFRELSDTSKHVTTITDEVVDKYAEDLDALDWEKPSKQSYFNSFRMFVRWICRQKNCDLYKQEPGNLNSKESRFRERHGTGRKRLKKRGLLWTPDEFKIVLKNVPQPYRAYLVLMLNAGFRSTDLNALRKDDVHFKIGRITIQREKMNQNEASPVISYPLWPITVELIKEAMSDDPVFMFAGRNGNRLIVQKFVGDDPRSHDNLSRYWGNNREGFGLAEKRLDFIRKTGSTEIERINKGVETLYLGETLSTVQSIHYNFRDGEPCADLDSAIHELGVIFGMVKDTQKRKVALSSSLVHSLERKARGKGLSLEQLLAEL
jgi:integrase